MADDSRAIVCDGGQQTAAGDVRQCDTPPDEEQDRGQDSTVAQPRNNRVRETTTPRDDPFIDIPEDVPILDFSPASTAVDPSDAKQDLGAGYAIGRFEYTPNATYTDEDLPASSDAAATLNQFNREQDSASDEDMESPRRETDLRRDIEGWGRQIGLTDPEIREAVRLVVAIPTGVRRNFGLETVCLGALTLAANNGPSNSYLAKSIRLNGPNTDNPDLVTSYEQLREDLGVRQRRVSDFRAWYNRNHS